jgi:hypothetical protein
MTPEERLERIRLANERFDELERTATEAERELGAFLQYLAFAETEQKEKAHPDLNEVAPLYLFLARRILSQKYNKGFSTVLLTTMQMRKQELESK